MTSPALRIRWRTTALVLVNALFLTLITLRFWKGTQTERILRIPAYPMTVPTLHTDLPSLPTDFSGLTDRTPFYANRRFYVVPSKPEVAPPPTPKYLFGGAVIRPHAPAVAVLNNPANRTALRVTAGKDVDGWHVESVETSRVVLRYQDQRAEIAAATKQTTPPVAGEGVTRAPLATSKSRGGGAHVLGEGQAVGRAAPAVANLPPLAGSGSESVYIPPPLH
jgi:hypothetical protein